MMNIDEVIAHAREVAEEKSGCWKNCEDNSKSCEQCEREHKQLAEWLEELKERREKRINCKYWNAEHEDCTINYNEIRNNVINDFAEKLMEQQIIGCMLPDGFRADVVTSHTIDMIAEQLKKGAGE